MQEIKISYNPYKMETKMLVNGVDVCNSTEDYVQFKEFIETHTPLQTWIEPISYKNWKGIVNELKADEEGFDSLEFHFDGRTIDFEDLKRVCENENENRQFKLDLDFKHDIKISDEKLAQNIDVIMESLLSGRFETLVKQQGEESAAYLDYLKLEDNYKRAKQKEFKIVFAGIYSSGKSTILNSIIRHNVLPTSDGTCTSKTCRICHDGKLKNAVSLECFDKEGNVVVKKETFQSDAECLKRFKEITPLESEISNPETVEVIELRMNLSHLYPSKNMEKAFNLVIIDTPGCNSSKRNEQSDDNTDEKISDTNEEENGFNNADKKIALDAIISGDREMVVICADAQDYDDESLGDFLKAIHESSSEDVGDFNDRFLFVLNKCDNSQFLYPETIEKRKNCFATEYLMNTKRWNIRKTSLKFVPRVFMISAYIYFALQQGVSTFSDEEIRESEEKQNLTDAYDGFYKKVIKRENKNYFLSQVCDVPDYRKKHFQDEFYNCIDNDKDRALEIQTGICCIEGAIQDYIARYAYPLKVKNLIETFDLLLESVKDFSDTQAKILQNRKNDLGKDITEREEVEKQKKLEEEKETALQNIKEKVESEKNKISLIKLDMDKLKKVSQDMDVSIETNTIIKRVREASESEKLEYQELLSLTENVSNIFEEAWKDIDKAFAEISSEYKENINSICSVLNGIALELKQFNIFGYDFSSSLALKKIQLRDANSLANDIQKTEQEKSSWVTTKKRNPIKDIEYEKWQIISRLRQYLASDTIDEIKEVNWKEYNLSSLKTYITDIRGKLKELINHAESNYAAEINMMKKNASKMADDVVKDINIIVLKIAEYEKKIYSLGDNTEELQREIDICKDTLDWLNMLIKSMTEGGRINE